MNREKETGFVNDCEFFFEFPNAQIKASAEDFLKNQLKQSIETLAHGVDNHQDIILHASNVVIQQDPKRPEGLKIAFRVKPNHLNPKQLESTLLDMLHSQGFELNKLSGTEETYEVVNGEITNLN